MTDSEKLTALLSALTVGGRLNPEKSRVVESYKYGRDPASFVRFESERGMRMRNLVRKEVAGETFDALAPIDKLLTIWAEYLSLRDEHVSSGLANPQDVKDFMRIGEAVETMVNDLRRHQWWAVRKSRGICSVWVFKDEHYEAHLAQAREILEKKMRAHIATARYFN